MQLLLISRFWYILVLQKDPPPLPMKMLGGNCSQSNMYLILVYADPITACAVLLAYADVIT